MLESKYDPKEAEPRLQEFWIKEGIYKFDPHSDRTIFTVDTPPPTVSGKMHLGHAFSYSQMDFIVRYHRMKGENVLCPFGTDDNGLPTEKLVEKENKVRSVKMERKEFVKLCLSTIERILPEYIQGWKSIGMSSDWDVSYSTIDEHCQRISQKSFIDLYKMGRIYRKKAPFVWCTECRTAISQVEMEDKEKQSRLVYIRFETEAGPITIATSRPEMMAACVGIYVHPDDPRYKNFIGKKATLPLYGKTVEIKPNEDVSMEFGSGVVYHCTFGDTSDMEWTQKMGTDIVEIINPDGTLNQKAGKYAGMKLDESRNAIIEDLQKAGVVEKIEPLNHTVNVHERCGTPLEILTTEQWFVKYLDLRGKFLEAGQELNWHPEHMRSRFDNWVLGLKWDWCISRQRYFGVPFPVWHCRKCKKMIIANEEDLPVDPLVDKPRTKCECGSNDFEPEKDVLDTWATSSLTPQIVKELFRDTPAYDNIYPMSLRPQAHDIIAFWLFNTLVKSQMHNNENPWKDVMISGWALDKHGKKMSKSKGNVVEPREVLEKYSADALRFWAASSKLGEDLPYQEKILLTGSKTVTKLWNASRFVTMNLEGYRKEKPSELEAIDKWILSKLSGVIESSTKHLDSYEYSHAKSEAELFFWGFTDNYLEIVKDRIYNPTKYSKESIASAKYTLYQVLLDINKLFAPFMPHVTEEIYQNFFRDHEEEISIHSAFWPKTTQKYPEEEKAGDKAVDIIARLRKFKSENNMALNEPLKAVVISDSEVETVLDDIKAAIKGEIVKIGSVEDGMETEAGIRLKVER
jgi:valyl-tRNA synthetase